MTPPEERLSPQARGGRARQAQLRAQLGDDGYRQFQQQQAHASNAAQIRAGNYTANRRAGYQALVARHGEPYARAMVNHATEARRAWRVSHPTTGEAAVHRALVTLGFVVQRTPVPFYYQRWRDSSCPYWQALSRSTALVEAYVGCYIVDVLLPHQQIAIEFLGGIHALQPDHDAARRAALRALGFHIIELTEQHLRDGAISTILETELARRTTLPQRATQFVCG